MYRCVMMGFVCLLASSLPVLAADDAPPTASAPTAARPVIAMEEPLPGDFWTYEMRDEIAGKIKEVRTNLVTEVTATEISVRFDIKATSTEGQNLYDRSWNLKSRAPWRYQPHDGGGIQSPLKVGASWKSAGDDVNPTNGNIWKRTSHSKVVGQETVTTRAGTFETFKIETTISRRRTNDPTRKMDSSNRPGTPRRSITGSNVFLCRAATTICSPTTPSNWLNTAASNSARFTRSFSLKCRAGRPSTRPAITPP
jgi:hypothetical protein